MKLDIKKNLNIISLSTVLAVGLIMPSVAQSESLVKVYLDNELAGILPSQSAAVLIQDNQNLELNLEKIEEDSEEIVPSSQDELDQKLSEIAAKQGQKALIYIGDELLCQVNSSYEANKVINSIKDEFMPKDVELLEMDMEIQPSLEIKLVKDKEETSCLNADEVIQLLREGGSEEFIYVAAEGDTLESIAEAHNMDLETLKSLNPELEEVEPGDNVKINLSAAMIQVSSQEKIRYKKPIPFDSITIEDPEMFKGESKVVQEGKKGQASVLASRKRLNNKTVSSITHGEEIISEPVTEIVHVGTKERVATGTFINPTTGRLSSAYGWRWGRMHRGIDIANSTGTPIKASDGGVVTRAGRAGSYGNLVEIDHQNGYKTRYAHCSVINVKIGQQVAQGEVVAKIGSTGRSTGPHLHFEVRLNNQTLNPLNFVVY